MAKGIILFLILAIFCALSLSAVEETIVYEDPFIVKKIKGQILPEDNTHWGPEPDQRPVFEVTGPGDSRKKRIIKLDENGGFNIKVAPGTYKFSIRIRGWDDAEGTIIVTKKAKKNSKIVIILGLS